METDHFIITRAKPVHDDSKEIAEEQLRVRVGFRVEASCRHCDSSKVTQQPYLGGLVLTCKACDIPERVSSDDVKRMMI